MKCPNCSAELSERPCKECGWPESTRPNTPKGYPPPSVEDEGGGCCAFGVAIVATALAVGFYRIGEGAHWTSDGPGMLFVYLGVGGFGLVAALFWFELILLRLARGLYAALLGRIWHLLPRWLQFLLL